MSTDAISPLRQRMIEDMSARKLNPHTNRNRIMTGLRSHQRAARSPGLPGKLRREIGITPALIRVSVGIEHPDDLIDDITRAFDDAQTSEVRAPRAAELARLRADIA
jgi:cystathionine beta-lyase/cystathionine gamma-synthase